MPGLRPAQLRCLPAYVYDGAGNLTVVKDASASSTVGSYTYTDAGLLEEARFGCTSPTTYRTITNTWDADSNRVGMNANGTGYSFVYDTTAGIPAVIEESSGGTSVYYIREPGGGLIARFDTDPNNLNPWRYYHFDELGSTRLLTDGDGTVTDRYAYDAYGALISHDRLAGSVDQPYQYVGQLGYYTHYQEPEFGLLQLGVRFCDPETARFTQRDPISRAEWSSYCYADGSPIKLSDPSGRSPVLHAYLCYRCHRCVVENHAKGDKELSDYLAANPKIKVDGSSPGRDEMNALGHCASRCWARRKCGKVCSRAWETAYEAWIPFVKDRLDAHFGQSEQ